MFTPNSFLKFFFYYLQFLIFVNSDKYSFIMGKISFIPKLAIFILLLDFISKFVSVYSKITCDK